MFNRRAQKGRPHNSGINPRTRSISSSLRLAVYEKYGGRNCAKCGKDGDIHIDHIIPRSRGGLTVLENLQPLCKYHNQQKGNRESV